MLGSGGTSAEMTIRLLGHHWISQSANSSRRSIRPPEPGARRGVARAGVTVTGLPASSPRRWARITDPPATCSYGSRAGPPRANCLLLTSAVKRRTASTVHCPALNRCLDRGSR